MTNAPSRNRLVPILWFVAATLAFLAMGIPMIGDGKPNWGAGAGGLFCVTMGVAARRQKA